MPDQDFNCYDPHANPDGQTPPGHYKVWMCKWPGKLPKTFTGTWEVLEPLGNNYFCDLYPRGEQQVTFTRVTKDCEDVAFYYPPMDIPEYTIPFSLRIDDPLVPEYISEELQAKQVTVVGSPFNGGNDVVSASCNIDGFSMRVDWYAGLCKMTMSLTGVGF